MKKWLHTNLLLKSILKAVLNMRKPFLKITPDEGIIVTEKKTKVIQIYLFDIKLRPYQ